MENQAAEQLLDDIHNLGMEREIEWRAVRAVLTDFSKEELTHLREKLASISDLADQELKRREAEDPRN